MFRGIIIEESINYEVLRKLKEFTDIEYKHLLNHQDETTILRVVLNETDIINLIPELLCAIKNNLFYLHFTDGEMMWVIFKGCVVKIKKKEVSSIVRCRKIGELFGINPELMKFEEMFEEDHPNG